MAGTPAPYGGYKATDPEQAWTFTPPLNNRNEYDKPPVPPVDSDKVPFWKNKEPWRKNEFTPPLPEYSFTPDPDPVPLSVRLQLLGAMKFSAEKNCETLHSNAQKCFSEKLPAASRLQFDICDAPIRLFKQCYYSFSSETEFEFLKKEYLLRQQAGQ
eukprot:gnl/Spiro4/8893_TR4695_c0_g1_i1.p1 gnl/Spiro4/8893_TR4695_c0_g1~~gnl/Spiro4/8893_TR4695_c0_g1_i1.p1  ORF type:complete len:169 (+),score=49.18 gnl/Spiro4/8893_TR4695_c0_g1_i1:39-509(+)